MTQVWGVLAFSPFLKELGAIPSGSHHLPLFSLSLALISPMCNESYLKPTKTSSTSLSQFQRWGGGNRQDEESLKRWGAWGGEGSSSPLLDPPQRLPSPRPSRDRPLSQLQAQPLGFCFMNCLFKEDLLGHPERTRGEGERELSPAAQSDRKPDELLFQ